MYGAAIVALICLGSLAAAGWEHMRAEGASGKLEACDAKFGAVMNGLKVAGKSNQDAQARAARRLADLGKAQADDRKRIAELDARAGKASAAAQTCAQQLAEIEAIADDVAMRRMK